MILSSAPGYQGQRTDSIDKSEGRSYYYKFRQATHLQRPCTTKMQVPYSRANAQYQFNRTLTAMSIRPQNPREQGYIWCPIMKFWLPTPAP